MAGTLYRAPAPGEPAFVKEGDKVVKGQTICIIEAMKLMNEIEVCSGSALLCCRALNGHWNTLMPSFMVAGDNPWQADSSTFSCFSRSSPSED